jgi:hypothetical protein
MPERCSHLAADVRIELFQSVTVSNTVSDFLLTPQHRFRCVATQKLKEK